MKYATGLGRHVKGLSAEAELVMKLRKHGIIAFRCKQAGDNLAPDIIAVHRKFIMAIELRSFKKGNGKPSIPFKQLQRLVKLEDISGGRISSYVVLAIDNEHNREWYIMPARPLYMESQGRKSIVLSKARIERYGTSLDRLLKVVAGA